MSCNLKHTTLTKIINSLKTENNDIPIKVILKVIDQFIEDIPIENMMADTTFVRDNLDHIEIFALAKRLRKLLKGEKVNGKYFPLYGAYVSKKYVID